MVHFRWYHVTALWLLAALAMACATIAALRARGMTHALLPLGFTVRGVRALLVSLWDLSPLLAVFCVLVMIGTIAATIMWVLSLVPAPSRPRSG